MTTVQIDKSSKGDLRHVEILKNTVVKPLLDKLLNGQTVKAIEKSFFEVAENKQGVNVEKFYHCTECQRTFKMERTLKTHFTKFHKMKQEKKLRW